MEARDLDVREMEKWIGESVEEEKRGVVWSKGFYCISFRKAG